MTALPQDPLEAALRIAEELEARGLPYAIGGALAYGLWAIPRATIDVDLNVFVDHEELDSVLDAFEALTIPIDRPPAFARNRSEGMFVLWWGAIRLDVFTPSIEFSWEALRTRVRVEIEGRPAWFLSAEATAVFKLLFFRTKDLADLERLVAVRGAALDRAYVRRSVVEMMGEDDQRVQAWDRIVEHGTLND